MEIASYWHVSFSHNIKKLQSIFKLWRKIPTKNVNLEIGCQFSKTIFVFMFKKFKKKNIISIWQPSEQKNCIQIIIKMIEWEKFLTVLLILVFQYFVPCHLQTLDTMKWSSLSRANVSNQQMLHSRNVPHYLAQHIDRAVCT